MNNSNLDNLVAKAMIQIADDGFCIIPGVLTFEECHQAIDSMRDFLEDTSFGGATDKDTTTTESYIYADHMVCYEDAGWLMGPVRELIADRVYGRYYDTSELHSAKEGFIYRQCSNTPKIPRSSQNGGDNILVKPIVRGFVSLTTSGDELFFQCLPANHEVFQSRCTTLNQGDVLLWRTSSVDNLTISFASSMEISAYAYCTQSPANWTQDDILKTKLDAYKQRQTGDCQPNHENWLVPELMPVRVRPYYRNSPPLLTYRLAELYGLVRYNPGSRQSEKNRAVIAGARFLDEETIHIDTKRASSKYDYKNGPHLVHLYADRQDKKCMEGQDKYLGGMSSPCGRYVYGVPGGAKRVLRVRVADGHMDWIGPYFEGRFKWLRGVEVPPSEHHSEYPNGCCIALPCNSASLLKIIPDHDGSGIYSFGQSVLNDCGSKGWHYHGGNLASNGYIYAIPANARRILKFQPYTEETLFIGPDFGPGLQKWYGGIVGCDGCIYGIPHNERGVLKIDPSNDTVEILYCKDDELLPDGLWKWHGGIRAGNKIYGYPNNADSVLVVDCKEQTVNVICNASLQQSGRHRIPQDGRYKYLGGSLSADKNFVYLFPCDAERVLRIDCRDNSLCLVGPLLLEGENKFQNGFTSRDGQYATS